LISFLINKLLYAFAVILGVAGLVFLLFYVVPGDPARMMLDEKAGEDQLEIIRKKYGLDKPVSTQFVYYYTHNALKHSHAAFANTENGIWVFKWPFLRESFHKKGKAVSSIIGETLPNTMILAITAITISIVIGITIGIFSALYKDTWFDKFWTVFGTFGMSLPSFFTAIIIAWLFGYVLSSYTGLSMTGSLYTIDDLGRGRYLDIKNLILPAVTLGIRPLGVVIQLMRNSLLETMSQDYIRTAKAKGLSTKTIVLKHALRNSLNPVVTTISGWFASMLAGAVFVEFIFGWNGLGKQIVDALNFQDLPVVMGAVLVIAMLFVVINIFVDLIYVWLDPKMR
jgi:peptide/nickel transport system permease protein